MQLSPLILSQGYSVNWLIYGNNIRDTQVQNVNVNTEIQIKMD